MPKRPPVHNPFPRLPGVRVHNPSKARKVTTFDPMAARGIAHAPTPLEAKKKANPTGRDADPRRAIPLNSTRWRKLRARILAEEPLCRMCSEPATDVDHISGDPSDNRRVNLQGLCHACHSHKTARERAGKPVVIGCDADGWPMDPRHPWNAKA